MDKLTNSKREEFIAHEAAEWVQRLESGGVEDESVFLEYLRESPRNVQEVLIAHTWDAELGQLVDPEHTIDVDELISRSSNVISMGAPETTPAPTSGSQSPQRRVRGQWIAIAAVVGVITIAFLVSPPWIRALWNPGEYTTSVGEQRSVELDDGSVIALNIQSEVRVNFSKQARDVYLDAGQAMFTVAKDVARPFRVHVGGSVVEAIGTKFDVRRAADRINVAVIEGRVHVTSGSFSDSAETTLGQIAERTKVAAGQAISIENDGSVSPPAPIDPAEVSAWQQRRLVFRNNTLAEIADEFARYNRAPQIVIEGDGLRAQRIPVAVFDADDPESLIVFLASDGSLSFDKRGDELIIRRRASAEASPN